MQVINYKTVLKLCRVASWLGLGPVDPVEKKAGLGIPFFKGSLSLNFSSSFLMGSLNIALPKFYFVFSQGS